MRQNFNRASAFVLLLAFIVSSLPLSAKAQVRAEYDMGAIGLVQLLKRLQTTASAMHTGAHPDDEDSALVARLVRGEQARTVYLSLNRGEGGQNVIGPEIFEPLGVIRTEELLQARRLDGGQQMFTRVMDYGFSKTRAEAAEKWDERVVLGDMVRAIRKFRPLVIISRFSGTPADGHGHHQLAGYLTPIAYKAAADPNQFPEQFQEGLRPWQAKKLYVGEGFVANTNNVPSLRIETGEYDSLIGRSYYEIAAEGRSQHKSQEMGSLELRGGQSSGVRQLEGVLPRLPNETSVFSGIDTSIKGIPNLVKLANSPIDSELGKIQSAAERALKDFEPLSPQKIVPVLSEGLNAVRAARSQLKGAKPANWMDADDLLAQKEQEFSDAVRRASGIVVDALADSETVVSGDSFGATVRVFAPKLADLKVKNSILKVPNGWTSSVAAPPAATNSGGFRSRGENATQASFFTIAVPANERPTTPYWLEKNRTNYQFDWTDVNAKNLPFAAPLVASEVTLEVGGTEITVSQPVQYRYADDIRGEIRRELNVVPGTGISLDSKLWVLPTSLKSTKRAVAMSITNNSPRQLSGQAKLVLPAGWTAAPASAPFNLKAKGDKTAVNFEITIPAKAAVGDYRIGAEVYSGGKIYNQETAAIAYPHIQTHRLYRNAGMDVRVLDLKTVPVNVGYIMGSGDEVPEAIKQMGFKVEMLDERALSTGNLARFDTIVVGIRASQVRPDFVANNGRLLDYVKTGGTLIVQYQRPDYVQQNLAPFPAKMDSQTNGEQRISNVRVTDENAPVKILIPTHPVFNFPNKISDADFQGWVQERDLYNFTTIDSKYAPLLESHDAGEAENSGGLVYAKIGKGNYVYNSYSFFRQLPSGVPGAYRIFANLLSLPRAKTN